MEPVRECFALDYPYGALHVQKLCCTNVSDTGKNVVKLPIEHRFICVQSKLPGHQMFQQRIQNTGPYASALILVA